MESSPLYCFNKLHKLLYLKITEEIALIVAPSDVIVHLQRKHSSYRDQNYKDQFC